MRLHNDILQASVQLVCNVCTVIFRLMRNLIRHAGFVGLFKGRYLRPLTVGTSLMLFQQITGQPSVLYYAADIFNKAGIDAGKDATGVSVILGVFKLVMTGVPAADAAQHAAHTPMQ